MNFVYFEGRLGFCEVESDTAWIVDDYGTLVEVPYSLPLWYLGVPA